VKRSGTSPSAGFNEAEGLSAMVVGDSCPHDDELRDLVGIGDFLAPEMHGEGGVDEAASAVGNGRTTTSR
jgi:hypothetical protein